jgi:HlyD family secretion protein
MAEVRTSRIRRNLLAALLVVLLLGGTATAWSTYVPLEGAVVASGVVVVETNLRKVQHPTGGVVGTLNVREGQRVEAGEIVVRLDDTTTRANLGIVLNELTALRARHARLRAERDGLEQPLFPDDLQGRAAHEPDIGQILEGERTLFRTRAATKTGQKQQLGERISQLKDEIAGLNEQMEALTKQLVIVRAELKDLSDLHDRGLAQRPRITSLQREILGKEGTVGEIKAKVAQSLGRIAEIELQVLQLDRDLANEVAKEIREVEIRIAELGERRTAAEDQLKRIDIRAPISGIVHQLNVHTVGGVISASEPIMLVVPATDTLIVEARINPADRPATAWAGDAHPLLRLQPAHHARGHGRRVPHRRRPRQGAADGADLLHGRHPGGARRDRPAQGPQAAPRHARRGLHQDRRAHPRKLPPAATARSDAAGAKGGLSGLDWCRVGTISLPGPEAGSCRTRAVASGCQPTSPDLLRRGPVHAVLVQGNTRALT